MSSGTKYNLFWLAGGLLLLGIPLTMGLTLFGIIPDHIGVALTILLVIFTCALAHLTDGALYDFQYNLELGDTVRFKNRLTNKWKTANYYPERSTPQSSDCYPPALITLRPYIYNEKGKRVV